MENNDVPTLTESQLIELLQAEVSWNNIRAVGSSMPFEQYLGLAQLSFPPEYVELVKSRDPFAAPKRGRASS